MKHLPLLAALVALLAVAVPQAALADPPGQLNGPPTANWFNIGVCVGQGGYQVAAGQPFALRLGRWVTGTRGLGEDAMLKDSSLVTVERPLGTPPTPVEFLWQSPSLVPDTDPIWFGLWNTIRWSPVFTLAAGEQMTITLTVASGPLPVRDLVPPSSTWDPTNAGLPPYDGTGLQYDGGVYRSITSPPVSCTVTGI